MGQAVLSDRVTPYPEEGVYLYVSRKPSGAKGNRVNIPDPAHGDRRFGVQRGNANDLGDVG